MRLLMTGGYGCIGAWVAARVVESGQDVWIYDLKEDLKRVSMLLDESSLKRVRFVKGDVADFDRLLAAAREIKATHILHLAGLQVPTCRSNPLLGARVNVMGTIAAFETAAALKGQIERVVYASSAAVHGPAEPGSGPIGDHVRLSPLTHYGAFKVCNELNARVYFLDQGTPSVGLRPWTVYGVGRDFGVTSEPTKAIKAVAAGRPYHISYGGAQDLQFVRDVADTFLICLKSNDHDADSFNMRGSVVSIETFVAPLIDIAPEAARLVTHGDRQLPIAYDLDDSRLEARFGPIPRTPLAEGIRLTYEHFFDLNRRGRLDLSDLE